MNLTDSAAENIAGLLKSETDALYVGVVGGGCVGYSLIMDIVKIEPAHRLYTKDTPKGQARVVSDAKSDLFLKNLTLDYSSSIMYTGFKIDGENITTCGCQKSFNLKE